MAIMANVLGSAPAATCSLPQILGRAAFIVGIRSVPGAHEASSSMNRRSLLSSSSGLQPRRLETQEASAEGHPTRGWQLQREI